MTLQRRTHTCELLPNLISLTLIGEYQTDANAKLLAMAALVAVTVTVTVKELWQVRMNARIDLINLHY